MSGFIIAVHGAAHCVLQPVEESSSRHHVVAVLSEKMEICQCSVGEAVASWGLTGVNRVRHLSFILIFSPQYILCRTTMGHSKHEAEIDLW